MTKSHEPCVINPVNTIMMVCYATQLDIFICITAVVSSKSSYIKFRCRGEVRQDGSVTVSSPGDMEFLYQLVSYSDGESIQYSFMTACFVAGCFLIIYLTTRPFWGLGFNMITLMINNPKHQPQAQIGWKTP